MNNKINTNDSFVIKNKNNGDKYLSNYNTATYGTQYAKRFNSKEEAIEKMNGLQSNWEDMWEIVQIKDSKTNDDFKSDVKDILKKKLSGVNTSYSMSDITNAVLKMHSKNQSMSLDNCIDKVVANVKNGKKLMDSKCKDSKVKDESKKDILHKYGFLNKGNTLRNPNGAELIFEYRGTGDFKNALNLVTSKIGIKPSQIDENKEIVYFFMKQLKDSKVKDTYKASDIKIGKKYYEMGISGISHIIVPIKVDEKTNSLYCTIYENNGSKRNTNLALDSFLGMLNRKEIGDSKSKDSKKTRDAKQTWRISSYKATKYYKANSEDEAVKIYMKEYPDVNIDDIYAQLVRNITNTTEELISKNMDSKKDSKKTKDSKVKDSKWYSVNKNVLKDINEFAKIMKANNIKYEINGDKFRFYCDDDFAQYLISNFNFLKPEYMKKDSKKDSKVKDMLNFEKVNNQVYKVLNANGYANKFATFTRPNDHLIVEVNNIEDKPGILKVLKANFKNVVENDSWSGGIRIGIIVPNMYGKAMDSLKTYKVNNKIIKARDEFDAIRKYKKMRDSKVKDDKETELYELCKKYRFYTYGDAYQYRNLLDNADKWKLADISKDIYIHSDPKKLNECGINTPFDMMMFIQKKTSIRDSKCKDYDDIEGVYQCKNDEVIEVRWDSKYNKFRISFQKGGSPIVVDKQNAQKLIRSYQGYKFQDSKMKDVDWDFMHKIRDIPIEKLKPILKQVLSSKLYKELEDDGFKTANIANWIDARHKELILKKLKDSKKTRDGVNKYIKYSIVTSKIPEVKELINKVGFTYTPIRESGAYTEFRVGGDAFDETHWKQVDDKILYINSRYSGSYH